MSTIRSRMTLAQVFQVQQLQGSWESAPSSSEFEMNSQIPSGMLPAKLLLSKNALSINGQLAIVSGMVPVRLLNEQSNFVISVQEPISDGKDPVRLLLAMSKNVKLVHRPISDGKDPLRLFLAMLKYVRLVHKSIAKGKEPDNLLKFRSNNASPNERDRSGESVPWSPFPARLTLVTTPNLQSIPCQLHSSSFNQLVESSHAVPASGAWNQRVNKL